MFTGIVKELGEVKEFKRQKAVSKLSIVARDIVQNVNIGDSIAVNGVCLTLAKILKDELVFEIMQESLKRTNLDNLKAADKVNLEFPLRLGDKISGHMVSGHVDGTGRVKKLAKSGQTRRVEIDFPSQFRRYIVPKGSIAIDGVSLTIGEIGQNWFSVYIIPHTLNSTRFSSMKIGDLVNIELDLMAKYAQNMVLEENVINEAFLRDKGFI